MRKLFGAMCSIFLLSMGSGILTISQSVWLHQQKYSSLFVGTIAAVYYIGFVYAAFRVKKLILRISHIRAYSFFAASLCAVTIIQGIYQDPWLWLGIRLIAGYCTAGLFVVIESWLLCQSGIASRGKILATYMIVYYAALALSQLLLNLGVERILRLFSLAAVCTSLSIIPLAITRAIQPQFTAASTLNIFKLFKKSPSGTIGALFSGALIGVVYNLLPIYLSQLYHKINLIALLMCIVIMGGMLFQIPFGKLSDKMDRRKVLFILFVILAIAAVAMLFDYPFIYLNYAVYFILGGAVFAIYPISVSYACDVLEANDMVAAAQGLVLANSIGLVLGPLLAGIAIKAFSLKYGLLLYFIVIGVSMAIFYSWRRRVSIAIPSGEGQKFVALPRQTSMTVQIDPRMEEDAQNRM